jgi:hypothetical protein
MPRAISRAYKHIGTCDCPLCSKEMPVKETEGGKLSVCCPWCDMPLYLNKGTEAFRRLMERVRVAPPPAPPAADPAASSSSSTTPPAPEPEPEKKPDSPKPPARSFASPLFGGR